MNFVGRYKTLFLNPLLFLLRRHPRKSSRLDSRSRSRSYYRSSSRCYRFCIHVRPLTILYPSRFDERRESEFEMGNCRRTGWTRNGRKESKGREGGKEQRMRRFTGLSLSPRSGARDDRQRAHPQGILRTIPIDATRLSLATDKPTNGYPSPAAPYQLFGGALVDNGSRQHRISGWEVAETPRLTAAALVINPSLQRRPHVSRRGILDWTGQSTAQPSNTL